MDYKALLVKFLRICNDKNGSDLHLKVGICPSVRVVNDLIPIGDPLPSPEMLDGFAKAILTADQYATFQKEKEIDVSFSLSGNLRYRANVYKDMNGTAISIRRFGANIFDFKTLGIPEILKKLAVRKNGLILVTGPTGSGKSTTLASVINYLNNTINAHIITLEDPIEFIHVSNQCIITQREVGRDTNSYAQGLRSSLRQDPDVIMLGEMRDLESIATALTAAETGHLVLATLHTTGAENAIDRIIDSFPSAQQEQIRVQLSMVLLCIVSQQLIPRANGNGRVLATEVLITNSAVRSLIRQNKCFQLNNTMSTSRNQGMYTINQCLEGLYKNGDISGESFKLYQTNLTAVSNSNINNSL